MFTAPLFTVARTWKQSRCPLMDEWIDDGVHIYNGILLNHKEEQIRVSCSEVDECRACYTK